MASDKELPRTITVSADLPYHLGRPTSYSITLITSYGTILFGLPKQCHGAGLAAIFARGPLGEKERTVSSAYPVTRYTNLIKI